MADGRGKVSFACPPQLPPRSGAGYKVYERKRYRREGEGRTVGSGERSGRTVKGGDRSSRTVKSGERSGRTVECRERSGRMAEGGESSSRMAGATLDAVEEIVEEQDLDVLFSDRSNITDVSENLSMAKKKELQHLMHMVQMGEEHNQVLRNRLQILREDNKVLSGASQAVEKVNVSELLYGLSISRKFKNMNLNYGANTGDGTDDV
ncbi:hypothetical protein LR48_Vigan01g174400 [Vigna angularis]|uniref:Uncharacterized protein n=1 Tax=Phaseolus angularis TaxID=3914 RepID=A0A0L9TNM8_PHAAN|nr:hypothetical protein LR48_Vigan01g174400 [Vigna angularis]